MGSSSSSLTEVQARRRWSIVLMMATQQTSSEIRSLVLQEQKQNKSIAVVEQIL